MNLARNMYPSWRNHKLSTLVANLEVEWNEDEHHRADYDSEARCGTAGALGRQHTSDPAKGVDTHSERHQQILFYGCERTCFIKRYSHCKSNYQAANL